MFAMFSSPAARVSAAGLLLVGLLSGCTRAPVPTTGPTATVASSIPGSVSPTPSSTSADPTPTTPAPTSTRPTTSSASTTPAGTGAPGCTTAGLTVTVERGSGIAGHQYATLVFTNSSGATCSLTGFPGVSLLMGGAPLAKPATRSGKPVKRVTLVPGATAISLLSNDSTCNADNSDSVQVIVPNQTLPVVLPLKFRGCTLTVDPVSAR